MIKNLEQIKSAIPISQLFSKYTEIPNNYATEKMVKCPFHDDDSPSMSIDDDKNIYHCFGCGASGDALTLIQEKENLDFKESVEYLANLANIQIEYDQDHQKPAQNTQKKRRSQRPVFIQKIQSNLATIQDQTISASVRTYQKNNKYHNYLFYPGLNRQTREPVIGTPAKALEKNQYQFYKHQSEKKSRMVSFGISLFGTKTTENSKYVNISRSNKNATHLIMISLDFDNMEWKRSKNKRDYKLDIDKRNAFLTESKKRLLERLQSKLVDLQLWQYAAIIDTGAGFHVHFVLDSLMPYSEIDPVSDPGTFNQGEMFEYLIRSLVLEVEADPQAVSRSSLFKIFPDHYYHKIDPPIKTKLIKDTNKFLSFNEFFDLFNQNRKQKLSDIELKKKFAIYRKCSVLFESVGQEPSQDFMNALEKSYDKPPSESQIELDFQVYIETGILPGADEATEGLKFYSGRQEWECANGSAIRISKNYIMQYRTKTKVRTSEGINWIDEWVTIPSGWVLIPKYLIQNEEKKDDFKIAFDCVRPGQKKRIVIDGKKFGATDPLQRALRTNQIDITIKGNSAAALFSYALTYAKPIKNIHIGVNYIVDDFDNVKSSFLVGWDFIYKDKNIYPVKGDIIEIDGETFYLNGYEFQHSNQYKKKFARKTPRSGAFVSGMIDRIDQLYQNNNVSKFFVSTLATAMVREQLIDRFRSAPILSLHGDSGCGKSTLLEAARSIFNQELLTGRPTVATTTKMQSQRKNGLLLFDELDENNLEHIISFLKDAVTDRSRYRQDREGNVVHQRINNLSIISTNRPVYYYEDAIDNRFVKIKFSKSMRKDNPQGVSDLNSFSERFGFEIYLELYDTISHIDFDKLEERVYDIEKEALIAIKNKDNRLARYYALIVAIGEALGILEWDLDLYEFISSQEEDRGSTGDILKSALLTCVADEQKELYKNLPDENPETHTAIDTKMAIPAESYLTLESFTKYLNAHQVFNNIDQKQVSKLLFSVSSVVKKRGTHSIEVSDHEWQRINKTFLKINFKSPDFKEYVTAPVVGKNSKNQSLEYVCLKS